MRLIPLAHCLLEELVVMGVGNPVREDDIKSLLSVRPPPEFFQLASGFLNDSAESFVITSFGE